MGEYDPMNPALVHIQPYLFCNTSEYAWHDHSDKKTPPELEPEQPLCLPDILTEEHPAIKRPFELIEECQMEHLHMQLENVSSLHRLTTSKSSTKPATFLWISDDPSSSIVGNSLSYWNKTLAWRVHSMIVCASERHVPKQVKWLALTKTTTVDIIWSWILAQGNTIDFVVLDMDRTTDKNHISFLASFLPLVERVFHGRSSGTIIIRNWNVLTARSLFRDDAFQKWCNLFLCHTWYTPPVFDVKTALESWLILDGPNVTREVNMGCVCPALYGNVEQENKLFCVTSGTMEPVPATDPIEFWRLSNRDYYRQVKLTSFLAPDALFGDWRDVPSLDVKRQLELFLGIGRILRPNGHWFAKTKDNMTYAQVFVEKKDSTCYFEKYRYSPTLGVIKEWKELGHQPYYKTCSKLMDAETVTEVWEEECPCTVVPAGGVFCSLFTDNDKAFWIWPNDLYTVEPLTGPGAHSPTWACTDNYCPLNFGRDKKVHTWMSHLPSFTGLVGVLYCTGRFLVLDMFLLPGQELTFWTDPFAMRLDLASAFVQAMHIVPLVCANFMSQATFVSTFLVDKEDSVPFDIFIMRSPKETLASSLSQTWIRGSWPMLSPSDLSKCQTLDQARLGVEQRNQEEQAQRQQNRAHFQSRGRGNQSCGRGNQSRGRGYYQDYGQNHGRGRGPNHNQGSGQHQGQSHGQHQGRGRGQYQDLGRGRGRYQGQDQDLGRGRGQDQYSQSPLSFLSSSVSTPLSFLDSNPSANLSPPHSPTYRPCSPSYPPPVLTTPPQVMSEYDKRHGNQTFNTSILPSSANTSIVLPDLQSLTALIPLNHSETYNPWQEPKKNFCSATIPLTLELTPESNSKQTSGVSFMTESSSSTSSGERYSPRSPIYPPSPPPEIEEYHHPHSPSSTSSHFPGYPS